VGGGDIQHFLLELDRGTERQPVWRDKVAALTLLVASPGSSALLTTQYVTVMVVTTDQVRREYLRRWTAQEFQLRGLHDEYASTFAITDRSPVETAPAEFFGSPHWHPPFSGSPDSLIDLPTLEPQRVS
jgi:hypothetical protein